MVRVMGLEPTRPIEHKHLKLACLPIPAHSQMSPSTGDLFIISFCSILSRAFPNFFILASCNMYFDRWKLPKYRARIKAQKIWRYIQWKKRYLYRHLLTASDVCRVVPSCGSQAAVRRAIILNNEPICIHLLYPQHLVFRFDRFRYAFLFGEFFYQPREHFLCLPVNVGKITVQLAACQQNVVTYPVILDTANAAFPICRYALILLRAVSGREDSDRPAIHTKVRFSRHKCTYPFCNPPIGLILPTIQSFRLITKAKGRGLPYEASPLGPSLLFM